MRGRRCDDIARPSRKASSCADFSGPAAAAATVQGAGSANPVGQAAVEGARDEGGRFGGNGCADPAQDLECVSQLLNRLKPL